MADVRPDAPGGGPRVLVREATVEDLSGVLRLYEQLAGDRVEAIPAVLAEAEALFAAISEQSGRQLLVGEIGGNVVGTADLLIVDNFTHGGAPWAVIENVVVDEDARRLGVGSALTEEAVRRCAAAGCYKVQLLSHKRRTAAHEFYRKMGFEAVAEGFRRYLT
jgi:ribosomal protein S18 acetylase RimI-like enzyme